MTRSHLTGRPAAVAAAVGLALALFALDASAQKVAGTWTLTVPSPRGEQTMTLGDEMSGTISGGRGERPFAGRREG